MVSLDERLLATPALSEGLLLCSYPLKEASALLTQEDFSFWFGVIGYWPITHSRVMGLLSWIQGIGLWLCLQHSLPLPSQFLLNLSLQMSISFLKGQVVVSSSKGLREKALRTTPSKTFCLLLLWLDTSWQAVWFSNTLNQVASLVVIWEQYFWRPAELLWSLLWRADKLLQITIQNQTGRA